MLTIWLVVEITEGCEQAPFTGTAIRNVVWQGFDRDLAFTVRRMLTDMDFRPYIEGYDVVEREVDLTR